MAMMTFPEDDATDDRQEREAEAMAQRWPISLQMRSQIIKTALELAGLEMTGPNTVRPIEGAARPKLRIRLAAMRILASYDRLSLQERKVDLLEHPSGEKPVPKVEDTREMSAAVAEECLVLLYAAKTRPAPEPPPPVVAKPKPVPAPKVIRQRWPIAPAVRGQIITEAFSLCGFAVTPGGQVEPIAPTDEAPQQNPRIVLAALRILASYDRISIEERRVELRFKPAEPEEVFESWIDPETEARIHELMDADDARIKAERRREEMARGVAQYS